MDSSAKFIWADQLQVQNKKNELGAVQITCINITLFCINASFFSNS